MENGSVIQIAGIRPSPHLKEKVLKHWEETHIPMLLKFRGLKKVTRCNILNPVEGYPEYLTVLKKLKPVEGYPEYLAISEFDNEQAFRDYENSPELAAATAESRETWKGGGRNLIWRVQYQVTKTLSR